MMDFNGSLTQELVLAQAIDRDRLATASRWKRQLRESERSAAPARRGMLRSIFTPGEAAERRRLFAEGLEAAQREGITVDAWFGFRFADPELSARAEWAGLVDDASSNRAGLFAA